MVDLHQHLVFGVDDGPKDLAAAQEMLMSACAQGVTGLVCTSHTMPGRAELDLDLYLRHLAQLRAWAEEQKLNVRLYTGCEILYTQQTVQSLREGRTLPLGESRSVLVEFRPDTPYMIMEQGIAAITCRGYRVVLAHVERYGCLRGRGALEELKDDHQILAQMNANTVIRAKNPLRDLWSFSALRRQLIDVVASDAHDARVRPCNMEAARLVLSRCFGKQYAEKVCCENPLALLTDGGAAETPAL